MLVLHTDRIKTPSMLTEMFVAELYLQELFFSVILYFHKKLPSGSLSKKKEEENRSTFEEKIFSIICIKIHVLGTLLCYQQFCT